MNRLDRHVGMVRTKLAIEQFLLALGYAVVLFFAAVLICVLINSFFWVHLPRQNIWFWSGLGATVVAAIVVAMIRRPTAHQAAIFIDEKLGLKEKFSTALYARAGAFNQDPFALAAIRDAERTADNVSLHKRFPISFPKSGLMAVGAGIVALSLMLWLPQFDLFGQKAKIAQAQKAAVQRQEAVAQAQAVLTKIQSMPTATQSQQRVELAKKEVQNALNQPTVDPVVVKDTAMKAQEEAEAAKQEEIKNNQAYAQAKANDAVFNTLNPSADDKGPVADAARDLANADFAKAVEHIQSLPEKFNNMTPEEQAKATEQMKAVASQLQKIAADPAAMQHLADQLKQQGVNQQQAQQIAKTIQQAAQGSPQAQQQLQQMQQQLTQQMNGGKGPTQQQQQQIQQAMQQMQSVAQSQAKAQQLTSAAQQMVQGMQAAQSSKQGGTQAGQQQASAKAGSAQQGGPKQGGQQASGQQGGTQQATGQKPGQQPGQQPGGQQGQQGAQAAGQQGGQQPGGQQANAGQPGGQQGNQQGGQGAGQQQMQQAGQQMAQAMGEMDAVKKDAEQQKLAQNDGSDQPGQGNGPGNQGNGEKPADGGEGPGAMGKPKNQPGGGMGGPGIGRGGVGQRELAQYSVNQVLDPSQNIAGGKVLAKSFVKADQDKGKATIQLSAEAKAAVKESTDDVSEESVPKDAQKVVKDYFDTVGQ